MLETTLVICKPDALERQLVGKIINRYECKGLKIVSLKLMQVTEDQAFEHYMEHKDKPFFKILTDFITSTPVIVMALKGDRAIQTTRILNGATKGSDALPGTIRGDFAIHQTFNLVHASDSQESAERELKIFFNDSELFEYKTVSEKWINIPR